MEPGVQAPLSWAPAHSHKVSARCGQEWVLAWRPWERICFEFIQAAGTTHVLVAAGLSTLAFYWLSAGGCLPFSSLPRGPLCTQGTGWKFASSRLTGKEESLCGFKWSTHSLRLFLTLLSPVMGETFYWSEASHRFLPPSRGGDLQGPDSLGSP